MSAIPKVGILGGGQLGLMLLQASTQWNWPVCCMDISDESPAALYKNSFTIGDIHNYDDVIAFGLDKDIITVEIENVNIEALKTLQAKGKKIHPNPDALFIIKNKCRQKEFYRQHFIPTADFVVFNDKKEAIAKFNELTFTLPCIYKAAEGGYDGKGVRNIRDITDVLALPDAPGLFEERVEIQAELAYSGCRNEQGDFRGFHPVQMEFDQADHILSVVYCNPEQLHNEKVKLEKICHQIMSLLQISGLLAVEFFLTKEGEIYVNEIAPRPHNSMHHTIENAVTSQFEQHLRGIMNFPLGKTEVLSPAIMYNLVGNRTESNVQWNEIAGWLATENCKIHLYGKKVMKPGRKMGHLTFVGQDWESLLKSLKEIKNQHLHV